jgi:DNA-binding PadR family transcriptional regulator
MYPCVGQNRHMALRQALLGLLAGRPMSGYELTKVFDRSLREAWPASHSQIYPELARLQREGLIERTETGPRGRKTYATTPAGVEEVRRWLRTGEPDRALRNEAALQAFFLWLLPAEEARAWLRREAAHHRGKLAEYERQAEVAPTSGPARASRLVLEWGIRYERMLVEWAEWAEGELPSLRGGASAGAGRPPP